jgi:hypothetical protein
MQGRHWILAVQAAAPSSAKKLQSASSSPKFSRNVARIYSIYLSEFVVSLKETGLIIIVALAAHHTPNLVRGNGTTCVGLGLPTDSPQYLLNSL